MLRDAVSDVADREIRPGHENGHRHKVGGENGGERGQPRGGAGAAGWCAPRAPTPGRGTVLFIIGIEVQRRSRPFRRDGRPNRSATVWAGVCGTAPRGGQGCGLRAVGAVDYGHAGSLRMEPEIVPKCVPELDRNEKIDSFATAPSGSAPPCRLALRRQRNPHAFPLSAATMMRSCSTP